MKLKSEKVLVEAGRPFENDELEREQYARALTLFAQSCEEPVVICVDAEWGQGKTTFLEMWRQSLTDKGIPSIYFSAWENDYSDNALVSLIGEIGTEIENHVDGHKKSLLNQSFDVVKSIGSKILIKGVPAAIKATTLGALDLEGAVEDGIAETLSGFAEDQIEKYKNQKNHS